MKVGVHHGSVLSLLLFIIVLEALSCEFCCGIPWKDLYADDHVIAEVKALDLERSTGEERAKCKCRKDLRYRTGSPAEFRRVPMHCLSLWSGQQQHLLQRL